MIHFFQLDMCWLSVKGTNPDSTATNHAQAVECGGMHGRSADALGLAMNSSDVESLLQKIRSSVFTLCEAVGFGSIPVEASSTNGDHSFSYVGC